MPRIYYYFADHHCGQHNVSLCSFLLRNPVRHHRENVLELFFQGMELSFQGEEYVFTSFNSPLVKSCPLECKLSCLSRFTHASEREGFYTYFTCGVGTEKPWGRKCEIHGGSEVRLSCFQVLPVSSWLPQQELQSNGWPRGYEVGQRDV